MTWKEPRLFPFARVSPATGDPVAGLAASGGSTFPDAIEGVDYSKDSGPAPNHRKRSHWFVPYLAAFGGFFMVAGLRAPIAAFGHISSLTPGAEHFQLLASVAAFWFLGCLCHIGEDALCGHVPLWNPRKRVLGVRLFKVRSLRETLFVYSTSLAMLLARGLWWASHLKNGIR